MARARRDHRRCSRDDRDLAQVGGNYENPRPLGQGAATWPGKASYLIPAGAVVNRVVISEKCDGGSCKKCEAPSDAREPATAGRQLEEAKDVLAGGPVEIVRDPTDLVGLAALAFPAWKWGRTPFRGDTGAGPSFGPEQQPVTGAVA